MMKCFKFTLIELLVVIGIIVLLAGLLLPVVINAQQKGRITQAKADMASILTALKGVENTYNRMVAESSTVDNFVFGGNTVKALSNDADNSGTPGKTLMFGGKEESKAYYAFIAELSDPNNSGLSTLNINKRKIKFLDAKTKYDPSQKYDSDDNLKQLWVDPWGTPYVLLLNTDFSDKIQLLPGSDSEVKRTKKIISGKAAMYSFGPNGTDEKGLNTLYDPIDEIKKVTGKEKTQRADDVTSWN